MDNKVSFAIRRIDSIRELLPEIKVYTPTEIALEEIVEGLLITLEETLFTLAGYCCLECEELIDKCKCPDDIVV